MNPDSVGPFSRPFGVGRLPPDGQDVTVVATETERAALAADLGVEAIDALEGRLRVVAKHGRVRVTGRVVADLQQTCVVSLEVFGSRLDEEVDVEFTSRIDEIAPPKAGEEAEADLDAPDELIGDLIDLGAITAEFLALGLDPHPRKPGVAFEQATEDGGAEPSPFAALAGLKREG